MRKRWRTCENNALPGLSAGAHDARKTRFQTGLIAVAIFAAAAIFYGVCLYPGLGGVINSGDSAKFQVLGHTSIMVHGPGYPLYLMLAALLRLLDLPTSPWWTITFALSAVPAAIATAFGFLIVRRITGSAAFGIAGALLLAGAHLMAVQATEAEVYGLNIAFVLATTYFLLLFVETGRTGFFLAACAIYALSFGNHLMMITLLPLFAWVTAAHYRTVLRPVPVAAVATFILVGASQYLYLAAVANDPATAFSEYMPLPPDTRQLAQYVAGTYFDDLYGSGLTTTRTAHALMETVRTAHPWISAPLALAGLGLFVLGWFRRDRAWRALAVVFGAALCAVPFVLWYGAQDIASFHLPVLAPLLLGAVASLGWALRGHRAASHVAAGALILVGLVRGAETVTDLTGREAVLDGTREAIWESIDHAPPGDAPVLAMSYEVRMAGMYHEFLDELPRAEYRLYWQPPVDLAWRSSLSGIVFLHDPNSYLRMVEALRPDLRCRSENLHIDDRRIGLAHAYECTAIGLARTGGSADSEDQRPPIITN